VTHAAKYGLLERLLTRSGILPALRQRVRDDIETARAQLDTRLQHEFTSLAAHPRVLRA
jgi:hypothetical protein